MSNGVVSQERFYRRGLVLGFTMAEIFVLIIFALLLALALMLEAKEEQIATLKNDLKSSAVEIADIKEKLEEKESQLAELTDKNPAYQTLQAKANSFDDFFRELVLSKPGEKAPKGQPVKDQIDALKSSVSQLQDKAKRIDKLVADVKSQDQNLADEQQVFARIEERMKLAVFLEQQMQASGQKEDAIKEIVDRMLPKLAELPAEIRRMESEKMNLFGQIKSLQKTLGGIGKGLEMPACWPHPDTGQPEYIYDVTLTSTGIVVHDNALPDRAEEQKLLPTSAMTYDREMSLGQFSAASKPLYDWSEQKKCRFFVRVYDRTGPTEKEIYKRHLKIVEGYFYKLER